MYKLSHKVFDGWSNLPEKDTGFELLNIYILELIEKLYYATFEHKTIYFSKPIL